MRIGILGATSQLAGDYIWQAALDPNIELWLFSRRPETLLAKLPVTPNARIHSLDYAGFSSEIDFDALINFVGAGDPATAASMGGSILDISSHHDRLALDYTTAHPNCRYIFLSSGAAYGGDFRQPATEESVAQIPLNALSNSDWYSVAKIYAEAGHRARPDHSIVDLRVFNYFSRTTRLEAKFLICDIIRAIRDKTKLKTSAIDIVRDFIGPEEFYSAVTAVLSASPRNDVFDLYSKAPIHKLSLLQTLQSQYGLQYELLDNFSALNATGAKINYYSLSRRAAQVGYRPEHDALAIILREIEFLI